jgi:hypothetical protein
VGSRALHETNTRREPVEEPGRLSQTRTGSRSKMLPVATDEIELAGVETDRGGQGRPDLFRRGGQNGDEQPGGRGQAGLPAAAGAVGNLGSLRMVEGRLDRRPGSAQAPGQKSGKDLPGGAAMLTIGAPEPDHLRGYGRIGPQTPGPQVVDMHLPPHRGHLAGR